MDDWLLDRVPLTLLYNLLFDTSRTVNHRLSRVRKPPGQTTRNGKVRDLWVYTRRWVNERVGRGPSSTTDRRLDAPQVQARGRVKGVLDRDS